MPDEKLTKFCYQELLRLTALPSAKGFAPRDDAIQLMAEFLADRLGDLRKIRSVFEEMASFHCYPSLPDLRAVCTRMFPPAPFRESCPQCSGSGFAIVEKPGGLTGAVVCECRGGPPVKPRPPGKLPGLALTPPERTEKKREKPTAEQQAKNKADMEEAIAFLKSLHPKKEKMAPDEEPEHEHEAHELWEG